MTPIATRSGSRIRGALALVAATLLAAGCGTAIAGSPLAATTGPGEGTVSMPSPGDASGTAQPSPGDSESNDPGDAGHVITENPTSEPSESGEPEKTGTTPEPTSPEPTSPAEPTTPENPAGTPEQPTGTSVATINDRGVITVAAPDAEDVPVIELFEDPLCPYCGAFEASYGEAVAAAVNAGQMIVRYHTVTFLDPYSSSGNYSTRALAALIALAKTAGDQPGLMADFHAALFNPAVQPAEGGRDLSNEDLAELADDLGAPPAAVTAIAKGRYIKAATQSAERNLDRLRSLTDTPGTPSLAVGAELIPIQPGWLDEVLGNG